MTSASSSPYPIALMHLENTRCVVVGGGAVATRKVGALLDSGARVRVISPKIGDELRAWRDAGRIEWIDRAYESGDLDGATLVFAATDRRAVNAAVADEARSIGALLNVADDPDGSAFHTLGAIRRGPLLVAIGTGGESPALAALIRRTLERTIGPEFGVLAERLGALRRAIGDTLPPETRTRLWRALATDEFVELARNNPAALDRRMADVVARITENQASISGDRQ